MNIEPILEGEGISERRGELPRKFIYQKSLSGPLCVVPITPASEANLLVSHHSAWHRS